MSLTPRDEWILGYAEALAKTHPELTPRQRFVEACQAYRDSENKANETESRHFTSNWPLTY